MAVRLLLLAPFVLLTPSPGRAAQAAEAADLRGRVVDDAQRSAVAAAEVTLLTTDSVEVGSTETGSDGFFLLSAEEPGRYLVRVEAGGYETVVRSVDLESGLRTVPAFVLPRTAIPVEGIDVEVESEPLPGRDVAPSARPMNLLAGERLARLERMGASFTAVVDQMSASLRVGTRRVGGPGGRRLPCIESTRTLPSFRSSDRDGCRWVAIVVDGVNTGMDGLQAAFFVQGLRLRDWESVEFLSNIDSGRYGLGDRGALLLWTRGSGPHRSGARDGGG